MPNSTTYNMTSLQDSLGFIDIGDAINAMSDGKFGLVIIVTIGVFVAISMIKGGFDNAVSLMGTGGVMFSLTLGLALVGWVAWSIAVPMIIFCFILVLIGIIIG